MPEITGVDTFQHGNFTVPGGGPYSEVNGTIVVDQSIVRSGDPASALFEASTALENLGYTAGISGATRGWHAFSWYHVSGEAQAAPWPVQQIFAASGNYARLYRHPDLSGKKFQLSIDDINYIAFDVPDDEWVRVQMIYDVSGTTHRADVRINGVTVASDTRSGQTASTIGSIYIGGFGTFKHRYAQNMWGRASSITDWLDDPSLYMRTVLGDDPVAYYRMDESSGMPQDSSGNQNHMTNVVGTPDYGQDGALLSETPNRAIAFLKASTERFAAPDHDSLDLGDVFSMECWVNRITADMTGVQTMIDKGFGAYQLAFLDTDEVAFALQDTTMLASSSITITDGDWHHVVATKDGATRKLYIDGTDRTVLGTNGTGTNNTHALHLGGSYANSQWLNAELDEVAIYNYALTPAQVLAHYLAATVQNKHTFYTHRRVMVRR